MKLMMRSLMELDNFLQDIIAMKKPRAEIASMRKVKVLVNMTKMMRWRIKPPTQTWAALIHSEALMREESHKTTHLLSLNVNLPMKQKMAAQKGKSREMRECQLVEI